MVLFDQSNTLGDLVGQPGPNGFDWYQPGSNQHIIVKTGIAPFSVMMTDNDTNGTREAAIELAAPAVNDGDFAMSTTLLLPSSGTAQKQLSLAVGNSGVYFDADASVQVTTAATASFNGHTTLLFRDFTGPIGTVTVTLPGDTWFTLTLERAAGTMVCQINGIVTLSMPSTHEPSYLIDHFNAKITGAGPGGPSWKIARVTMVN